MSKERTTVEKGPDYSEPYIHHANSLFHFVKKREYVFDILERRVIFPRYFVEDIKYLEIIDSDGIKYENVAILGVCFCDIPLSQICIKEDITYLDKNIPESEQKNLDHTELYGKYAIGFSKDWGVSKGIRPLHYEVYEIKTLSVAFRELYSGDEAPDSLTSLVLDCIAYSKPVNGTMVRSKEITGDETVSFKIGKNFYNEQEWRYIPPEDCCRTVSGLLRSPIKPINAAKYFLDEEYKGPQNKFNELSNRINALNEKSVGLDFEIEDIQYIIVPDSEARVEMINRLELMCDGKVDRLGVDILMSKIHLLSDIRRDY